MPDPVPSASAAPSARGAAKLVVLLGALTAFAPLSTDMYLAAFPAMAADLGTDVGRIQLSLAVFFVGLAVGQLLYGPLSDRLGRRGPLMAGLALYSAASAALAACDGVQAFLALRLVQAFGGCAGMIISRAVVRDLFDVESSARFFTLMMAVQSIAPVAAPVAGAYVLGLAPWRALFWLMAAIGVACLAAARLALPESLAPDRRAGHGLWESLAVFGRLLRRGDLILPALAGAVGGSALFAFISASPFVLMGIYGLDRAAYALVFALVSLGTALFAQLNVLVLKRLSARGALALGLAVLTAFGSALALLVGFSEPTLPVLLATMFPALAAVPVIFANSTALAMAASGRYAGTASSLVGVFQFGMAGLTSALVGALHDGTARPMALAIPACGLAASLVWWLARRTGRR